MRELFAPALATCVHMSLVGSKQALLPHILSEHVADPGDLAKVLGRLALLTSLSAVVCMPVMSAVAGRGWHRAMALVAVAFDVFVEACYSHRAVFGSARALAALAVVHGASVVVVALSQSAMVARREGEGQHDDEGKVEGGRGALLTSRYGALGGAMSLGGVAGATLGTLAYHRLGPAAPFRAGSAASLVSLVVVFLRWPRRLPKAKAGDVEDASRARLLGGEPEESGDESPRRGRRRRGLARWCGAAAADVFRGFRVLAVAPVSRRAFLLFLSFALDHSGVAVAAILFPYFKFKFGMRQATFAALLTLTHVLRFVAQGLALPSLPERVLGPRRRQRLLLLAQVAKAAECLGLLLARSPGQVAAASALVVVAGLAEPLMRAELMLEVPDDDAAHVKGALAVVVLFCSRGFGPYVSGWLFALGTAPAAAAAFPVLAPGAVFLLAGALFCAAAAAVVEADKCPRNDGTRERELSQILDVFGKETAEVAPPDPRPTSRPVRARAHRSS